MSLRFRLSGALCAQVLAVGVLALAMGGCATGGAEESKTSINRIEARIDEMAAVQRAGSEAMGASIKNQAELAAAMTKLQDGVTMLGGRVEELNARSQMLGQKLDGLKGSPDQPAGSRPGAIEMEIRAINLRLEKLTEKIKELSANVSRGQAQQPTEAAAEPSAPVDAPKTAAANGAANGQKGEPGELYQKAYESYLAGRFDDAVAGFGQYAEAYPETELSDNAAYWLAEAYLGKKDIHAAGQAFERMATRYPSSNKAPTALLRGAEISLAEGKADEAQKKLKLLIGRYPSAPEAKSAAGRLKELSR